MTAPEPATRPRSPVSAPSPPPTPTRLSELALLFLRLGATAFGGPAAHIAMMRDEVVTRRRWLDEEHFLDLLGATNLIPGPNSTEMAIHIGWARRRWLGLWVAGTAFIVPAMLITAAFGVAYVRWGKLPAFHWLSYGVKPVIIAVVAQAIIGLLPKAAKTAGLRLLGAAATLLAVAGVDELFLLFASGAAVVLLTRPGARRAGEVRPLLVPLLPALASNAAGAATLPALFWVFLKTGSVLFGSGYVLLAFLRTDLVERLRWLTEAQLIDAIAVGQVTPGPVFTTATFIGYVLLGPSGALVATLGIFLPAFVFVALSGPLVPRLRASALAGAFLDGVNVASLGLMLAVTLELARAALVDVPTLLLGAAAAVLLLRFELNTTWLILGGAAIGYAVHALGAA
jgi:chromate transporter